MRIEALEKHGYKMIPIIIICCIGIVISSLLFFIARKWEHSQTENSFRHRAVKHTLAVKQSIEINLNEMEALATFLNASETLSRKRFNVFAKSYMLNSPGIQALGWIPRVLQKHRIAYEGAARNDGFPNFQITEWKKQGEMVRAHQRKEYYPVYFVEPYEGNEIALGFDLASNPVQLKVLEDTRDCGRMQATERTTLVHKTEPQSGSLIFVPIYYKDSPTDTLEHRRKNLRGFALGVFRVGKVLESIIKYLELTDMDVYIFDNSSPQNNQLLCFYLSKANSITESFVGMESIIEAAPYYIDTIGVAGCEWQIICTPGPDFIPIDKRLGFLKWGLTGVGIAFTSFLIVYIMLIQNHTAERERSKALAAVTEKLEIQKSTLQATLDAFPENLYVSDPKTYEVLLVNKAFKSILGKNPVGGICYEEFYNFKLPCEFCTNEIILRERGNPYIWEYYNPFLNRDYLITDQIITWPDGRDVRFEYAFDITDRKRMEKEIEKRAIELSRSNTELEQFAYVISHDLQEPLRKIQAFGDRLGTRCKGSLDETGQNYLERMLNAAERMKNLINDLLAYSRVGTRGILFTQVDLAQIAKEVASDLEVTVKITGGQIEIGTLHTIDADPAQMRQLLQNLMQNGLKFHKKDEKPVIKVYSQITGNQCQLFVEDNGIGFDEKYLDRIFVIFQRLQGSAYDGTGIGLAVCRRVAERHGGSITARSSPGNGAKFIVTLPVVAKRLDKGE